MNLDQILTICLAAGVVVAGLAWLICTIIRIAKMTPEERTEEVKTYLKGLIALAEKEFVGPGRGAEKLENVIKTFHKNAPVILRMILTFTGVDTLEELIEKALTELKENFNK